MGPSTAARSGTTFEPGTALRLLILLHERLGTGRNSPLRCFDYTTGLANCELQIANPESLRVLRALRGKKTSRALPVLRGKKPRSPPMYNPLLYPFT